MWDVEPEEESFYCYACGRALPPEAEEDTPGCDRPDCFEMFLKTNKLINEVIETRQRHEQESV